MAIETRRGVERQNRGGLTMRLGSGPEAAASARSALSRLRADLDQPLVETLRLLVTELVTNSVRHTAADSLTLSVAIGRSAVLTEVADTGPGFDPQCVENSGNEDTGWGLYLVERLADKWGVRHDGPSKRVWFELRRA
jgi:anti-sigma regulatory factor (Ser/Thr protein kinase)